MGVRQFISRIAPKRIVSDAPFFASTVRIGEEARSSTRAPRDMDAERRLSKMFGFVAICADRVSKDASCIPLRLYKPKFDGTRAESRRVTRSVKSWLASGSAGRKAAQVTRNEGDVEEVVDHPILDIIDRPNTYQSGHGFRELRHLHLMVGGNAYIIPSGRGVLERMHLLMPQWTRVLVSKEDFIDGYAYGRDTTSPIVLKPDDVWHSKFRESPFDPYHGRGAVDSILTEQDVYAAIMQWTLASYANGQRPDSIVSTEQSLNSDQRKALEAQLEGLFRGPKNSSKALVVGGAKVSVAPLSWPPKDMGEYEVQDRQVRAVLAAFGVPESEIFMNDANRAVSERGNLQYMRQTVMPMVEREANDLTRWVVEDSFGLDGWFLAPENAVPDDEDSIVNRITQAVASGWMTYDEGRADVGMDPLPDGMGAVPRVNGVRVDKLDTQASQPANPFAGVFGQSYDAPIIVRQRGGGDAGTRDSGSDAGGAAAADATALAYSPDAQGKGDHHGDTCTCGTCKGSAATQSQLMRAKALDDAQDQSPFRDSHESTRTLYYGVRSAIVSRRDEILSKADAAPHGLKSGAARSKSDDILIRILKAWGIVGQGEAFAELAGGATMDAINQLLRIGGESAAKQLSDAGVDLTEIPILDNPEAVKYFEAYRSQYIKNLAESDATQAARLESSLREGLSQGETLSQMKERIVAEFDGAGESGVTMTDYRSALIARTETAEAQVQGTLAGYAGSGAVKGYKFFLAPNACEFCMAAAKQFEGVTVPLGTPLFQRGSVIQGTEGGTLRLDYKDTIVPIHPQCRCAVEAVLV